MGGLYLLVKNEFGLGSAWTLEKHFDMLVYKLKQSKRKWIF